MHKTGDSEEIDLEQTPSAYSYILHSFQFNLKLPEAVEEYYEIKSKVRRPLKKSLSHLTRVLERYYS